MNEIGVVFRPRNQEIAADHSSPGVDARFYVVSYPRSYQQDVVH